MKHAVHVRIGTKARAILFVGCFATGCAGLIGVPDLTFDGNAEAGNPNFDGNASSSSSSGGDGASSGSDGSSSGADGPPQTCVADLKTDKANCGACGHDCTNGLCADGLCTLMDKTVGAQAIALRGNTLYLGFEGDGNPAGVVSCPTNGCASPTVAAKPLLPKNLSVTIEAVGASATHVFSSDYYNTGGPLRSDPADGGYIRLPATGQQRSFGLAVDSTSVYWTEVDTAVHYCALPDCAGGVKLITTAVDPDLIAVADNGNVLYGDNNSLKKCNSKTDCATPASLPTPPGYLNDLKIVGTTVYFAWRYELLACQFAPTICANVTTLVPTAAGQIITTLAVADTTIYWAMLPFADDGGGYNNSEGVVSKCEIANCAATTKIIATKQKAPAAMAIDSKSIYWVNNGRRLYVDGMGSIIKAPR